MNITVSS